MSRQEVRVEARPGASRERVERIDEHQFRISVREEAQGGEANSRIRAILAREYGVRLADVQMRTGARSPRKRYDVILG